MAEQVYEIAPVRKSAVALLRSEDRRMTTSELAAALGLPYWCVDAAMEQALQASEVAFEAGAGWCWCDREDARRGGDDVGSQGEVFA